MEQPHHYLSRVRRFQSNIAASSGSFGLVFVDAGSVWDSDDGSVSKGTAVHTSVGYGILLENALRVRVARAVRSGARAKIHVRWAREF